MARLTIVILAAALLTAAALQSVAAQEATGSISGRIVFEGEHRGLLGLLIVSADDPQPIDDQRFTELYVEVDGQGNFSIPGLADGDYFLVLVPGLTPAEPLPEGVDFFDSSFDLVHTLPALRVTVAGGEAVTGVEIPIMRLFATPTPLPPPGLPGSISGHIVFDVLLGSALLDGVSVVSADVPQPIPIGLLQNFPVDGQNNFVVTGLEGGEYFLLVGPTFKPVEPAPEEVLFLLPPEAAIPKTLGPLPLPAIRVTLPAGGAVTGLEISVTLVDDLVFGPSSGAGPGGANDMSGRIMVGLAVVAALLLAGGVALRTLGRRA